VKKRIGNWAFFMWVVAALSACNAPSEAPLPTDAVKDQAMAMRLGQEACAGQLKRDHLSAQKKESWQAELHQGVWHVWQELITTHLLKRRLKRVQARSLSSVFLWGLAT
jgi:hypothetical protein